MIELKIIYIGVTTMDLTFLQSFCIPTIVGICLCVGYVIKYSLTFIPNKYIPLIMALLGLTLNIFIMVHLQQISF